MGDAQGLCNIAPVGLELPLELALVAVAIEAVVVLEKAGPGRNVMTNPGRVLAFSIAYEDGNPALTSCVRCGPSWSLIICDL